MINLSYKVDGKSFDDFDKAIDEALVGGIKKIVNEKLKHLKQEIQNSKGKIIVTVSKDYSKLDLTFNDIEEDLIEKITKCF